MPHMALSGENEPGKVWRPGREKPSHACGALLAVLDAIKSGKLHLKLQHDDVEMSLIKQEVLDYMKYGQVPDLTELTYAVHECIADRVTGLKGPPGSPWGLVDPRPLLAGSPHFGVFSDPRYFTIGHP
jgi:hypothetical protein